jgi:outer membrane protein assembly factor BamB
MRAEIGRQSLLAVLMVGSMVACSPVDGALTSGECISCVVEDVLSGYLDQNWPGRGPIGPVDAGGDGSDPSSPLSLSLTFSDETLSGLVSIEPAIAGGAVIGVEFYVDDVRVDTDLVPPYNYVLNTTQYPDGPHSLSVYTANVYGYTAQDSVDVVFDNTPPQFDTLSPAENEGVFFEDGPLTVTASSVDAASLASVEFRANGLLVGSFTEPPFTATVPWDTLYVTEDKLPAEVFLQVHAVDLLGQVTDVTYTVTVHQRRLWSFETLGEIRGEAVYIPSTDQVVFGNALTDGGGSTLPSKLYALNTDGSQAWSVDVQGAINWAAVYVGDTDLLYVGGDNGVLYTYNTGGGGGWSLNLQQVLGGKVRYNANTGRIYTVSYEGVVWAVSASNGGVAWTYNLPSNVLSVPALGTPEEVIYVPCFDGSLHAVTESGGIIWSKQTGGEVRSSPVVGPDGTIYFGSNDGYVYAVTATGEDVWDTEVEGLIQSELLWTDSHGLFVLSSSKFLSRLDPLTGDELWATKVGGATLSSPRQGPDGTIYGATTSGEVWAVDPEDGAIKWTMQVSPEGKELRGTVLVVEDRLYVGSVDRNFYALRLAPPE